MYGNQTRNQQDKFAAALSNEEIEAFTKEINAVQQELTKILPDTYLVDSIVTEDGPANQQGIIFGESAAGLPFKVVIPVTLERLESYNTTDGGFLNEDENIAIDFAAKIISIDKESPHDFEPVAS